MRRIGAPCTAVRVSLCRRVCVCACVRVCVCACVCVNRALRALSTHKPPVTSKPAQTASFLSRGGAPEAKVLNR